MRLEGTSSQVSDDRPIPEKEDFRVGSWLTERV